MASPAHTDEQIILAISFGFLRDKKSCPSCGSSRFTCSRYETGAPAFAFRCHSCGEVGNAIGYVMLKDKKSFHEAVSALLKIREQSDA